MQNISINVWAVIAAAVIRIVVGGAWFSPPAFQSPWLKIVGMDEATMRAGLPRAVAVDIVASLVMAFILAHSVVYAGASTLWQGAAVGFFNWLGFIAAIQISETMHEHRPLQFFWITTAYNLIALVLMGALLAAWR